MPTHLHGTQPTASACGEGVQRIWHQSSKTAKSSTCWPRTATTPRVGEPAPGSRRSQTFPVIRPATGAGVGVKLGVGVAVAVDVGVGVEVDVGVGDGVAVAVQVGVGVGVGEWVGVCVAVGTIATGAGVGVLITACQAQRPARQATTRQITSILADPAMMALWLLVSRDGSAPVIKVRRDFSARTSAEASPS